MINNVKNGILIPVNDYIELYNAMKNIIKDPVKTSNMSKQSIKVREEYSVKKIVDKWVHHNKFNTRRMKMETITRYINLIKKYLRHPKFIFLLLDKIGIHIINDKKYISMLFESEMGYKIDFNNPRTFNEKLQWLKLYNRKDIYTTMVDKYEVKKYVSGIIGDQYIIPTIAVYDKFEEINFEKLPNQFVIKCTHDSGGLVICKDKTQFNIKEAKRKIKKCLKKNYYYTGREWPYKNVKPRIIIEKYMEDKEDKELRDYKLYCFNGYVKATLLATNRMSKTEELCFDYFDENFKHLNLTNHWHPNANVIPHCPKNYNAMVELAKKLSKEIPHVRVDFYEVNGKIYFGELTFFDMSGFLKIHPDDWELEWGNLIDLNLVKKNEK